MTLGGSESGGAAYDSSKGEVFIVNYDKGTVSVISDATNSIVATVDLGSGPWAAAYDPAYGEVFVTHSVYGPGTGLVSIISDTTNTVVANVSVPNTSTGLAYDPAKSEMFVSNSGLVSVVSGPSNTVTANVTVGAGSAAEAYDSGKGEVFVANFDGSSVSVISDSNNSVVSTIDVGTKPSGLAYDPKNGEVFVSDGGSSQVSVISDATNTVVATINVGSYPTGVIYDPSTDQVLVANEGDGTVSVLSGSTGSVVATSPMGGPVHDFAYDSAKSEVFVVYSSGGIVNIIPDTVSSVSISGSSTSNGETSSGQLTSTTSAPTVACTAASMTAPATSSPGIGGWAPTTCYPDEISGESCVTSGGYIYCVGGGDRQGLTSAVYYASLSSAGVGQWTATTSYPETISSESCNVQFAQDIYCVGGDTTSQSGSAVPDTSVYVAPISSAGVGNWTFLGYYPTAISDEACVVAQSAVDCVGGFNGQQSSASDILGTSDQVFYNGGTSVPSYLAQSPYPIYVEAQSCSGLGDYIYCVGGFTVDTYVGTISTSYNTSASVTFTPDTTSAVYFAPLSSSSGTGTWSAATSYPTKIFAQSCVQYQANLYCIGGDQTAAGETPSDASYYAALSSSGTSSWTATTSYPNLIESQSCVAASGYIYCVGGFVNHVITNAVCYAQIGPSNSTSSGGTPTSTCAPPPQSNSSSTNISTESASQTSPSTGGSFSLAFGTSYLQVIVVEALVILGVAIYAARKRKIVWPSGERSRIISPR